MTALLLAAAAATAAAWCPPPLQTQALLAAPFAAGLPAWRVEAEHPATRVGSRADGTALELATPAGLTLWLRQPLQGDYAVRFTAVPLPAPAEAGALAGRVSDLNLFWNASEPDGQPPGPRDGRFASHDTLRAYYAGLGANGNRTTRLRLYDGQGARVLLDGWADAAEAGPGDRHGALPEALRLRAGQPVTVQLVSRRASAQDPATLRLWQDDRLLFERAEAAPLLQGHFALRTTASAFRITQLQAWRCLPAPPGAP